MRRIAKTPLAGGRLRLRALVVLTTLLALVAVPSAAGAAEGVQVTINGAAGPFFTTDQIDAGADANPNRMAWWPELSANQPQTLPVPGMSVAELVRRSGVAPGKLADGAAVHVSKPASEGSATSDSTLTRDQVVNGIPNPLDASEPSAFAVFSVNGQPRFERPMLNGTDPSDELYAAQGGTLTVDLTVVGDVLPVTVTADGASSAAGDEVQFTAHPGGASSGWTYSWDFGDGSAQTATALPGRAHTFTDTGTYQVRVTVDDGAGNAGVSPPISLHVVAQTTTGSGGGSSTATGSASGQASSPGAPSSSSTGSPVTATNAPGSFAKAHSAASGKGAASGHSRSVGPVRSDARKAVTTLERTTRRSPSTRSTAGGGHGSVPPGRVSGSGGATPDLAQGGRAAPDGRRTANGVPGYRRVPLQREAGPAAATDGASRHGVKGVLLGSTSAVRSALISDVAARPGTLAGGRLPAPPRPGRGGGGGLFGGWAQWALGIAAVAALLGWGIRLETRPRIRRSRA